MYLYIWWIYSTNTPKTLILLTPAPTVVATKLTTTSYPTITPLPSSHATTPPPTPLGTHSADLHPAPSSSFLVHHRQPLAPHIMPHPLPLASPRRHQPPARASCLRVEGVVVGVSRCRRSPDPGGSQLELVHVGQLRCPVLDPTLTERLRGGGTPGRYHFPFSSPLLWLDPIPSACSGLQPSSSARSSHPRHFPGFHAYPGRISSSPVATARGQPRHARDSPCSVVPRLNCPYPGPPGTWIWHALSLPPWISPSSPPPPLYPTGDSVVEDDSCVWS